MLSHNILRDFLLYTLGVGVFLGGIVAGAASFWATIPPDLLAIALMAPGLLIAPFLLTADTGLSTIDESAEAGFVLDDPSQYRVTAVLFPGRLQLSFVMIGFFIIGLVLFLA